MIRFKRSVSSILINILEKLMAESSMDHFTLGGGTSLALRFGHRRSIDIDLFSTDPFDTQPCMDNVRRLYSEAYVVNRTAGSLCMAVDGVKLDLLHHPYPLLAPVETVDTVRCLSLPDIAAMKVNAMTNRGSKKDFSDLLMLHEQGIPLKQSLDYFCVKYGEAGRFLAIRSFVWYEDAELEPDPVYLNGWTWEGVRDGMMRLAKKMIK